MFNFKTTKKQIQIFERNIAKTLQNSFPEIYQSWENSSSNYSLKFLKKPSGIYLVRNSSEEKNNENFAKQLTNFDLYGLKLYNKRTKFYEEIVLYFHQGFLTLIEVDSPMRFHANYDYENIQIGILSTKEVFDKNQDETITLNILKDISAEKLNQLDMDKAIEIEINDNVYYTILDLNEGNYIAVNKSGKVFRLDHNSIEKAKQIANDIVQFFNLYKGKKSNLMQLVC